MIENLLSAFPWLARNPTATLGLLAFAFFVLAYVWNCYPTRRVLLLVGIPCVLSLAVLAKRDVLPLILTLDIAIALLLLLDLPTLPRQTAFSVEREIGRVASLHNSHPVSLTLTNPTSQSHTADVCDDLPADCSTTPQFDRIQLPQKSRVVLHYRLDCHRRGAHRLQSVFLRGYSRFKFWHRQFEYPVTDTVNVYPDIQQLSRYALLARTNRLRLMGVRRHRKIGVDNEFERLRDFTRDDQFKHIDWRSTARRNRLTVRDFQSNQSQRIVFLVDCGRMMVNRSGPLTLLDHALNAMLMLAYVALRHGDSVGMLAFSDSVHSFLPARGGMQQMNRLMHASFDRFPRLCESRYDEALLHLSRRCRKRSLVVLLTNVIDGVNANQIERYLGNVSHHHLPLCVLLRDPRLSAIADRPLVHAHSASGLTVGQPSGSPRAGGANPRFEGMEVDEFLELPEGGLYAAAAAASIMTWRQQVINQLKHRGVLIVDALPDAITAPLINQYLDIKARHLL